MEKNKNLSMIIYSVPIVLICIIAVILLIWNEVKNKKLVKNFVMAVVAVVICLGLANQLVSTKIDTNGFEDEVSQGINFVQEDL